MSANPIYLDLGFSAYNSAHTKDNIHVGKHRDFILYLYQLALVQCINKVHVGYMQDGRVHELVRTVIHRHINHGKIVLGATCSSAVTVLSFANI